MTCRVCKNEEGIALRIKSDTKYYQGQYQRRQPTNTYRQTSEWKVSAISGNKIGKLII